MLCRAALPPQTRWRELTLGGLLPLLGILGQQPPRPRTAFTSPWQPNVSRVRGATSNLKDGQQR